jgi:F-type H+-transporting ATPase subunit epsilon
MITVLFEVVTPDRVVMTQEVRMISIQTDGGELGILPRHAALAATVKPGVVKLKVPKGDSDLTEDFLFVKGGFLEVLPERVTLLADTAELASQIDVSRAEHAKERAQARINQRAEGVDLQRAEAALKRAMARLETVHLYSANAGHESAHKQPH